jgi:tRNA (guanine37-N1)-methyltransferase
VDWLLKKIKEKLFGEKFIGVRSFDIIGSKNKAVAIVEIPKELSDKLIAKEIMKRHKNVKSVLKKVSKRKGVFRVRDYELIAGDVNTEVIHKEYGCLFRLDPKKVYFSPREGTERQRVASQVKPNENVMVMFSGVSPFPIIIAKRQPKVRKIYAIELNPDAHRYAVENVRINKLKGKVIPILGDVREVCKKYHKIFDRVVMPLPLGAESYLDIAINCLKKNGVVHFYSWGKEEDPFTEAVKNIKKNCKKLGKSFKILNKRKVLQYAQRIWKVCVEFRVLQG